MLACRTASSTSPVLSPRLQRLNRQTSRLIPQPLRAGSRSPRTGRATGWTASRATRSWPRSSRQARGVCARASRYWTRTTSGLCGTAERTTRQTRLQILFLSSFLSHLLLSLSHTLFALNTCSHYRTMWISCWCCRGAVPDLLRGLQPQRHLLFCMFCFSFGSVCTRGCC